MRACMRADVARGSGALATTSGLGPVASAAAFSAVLGGLCYACSPRQVESANSTLVLLSLLPFVVGGCTPRRDMSSSGLRPCASHVLHLHAVHACSRT